MAIEVLNGYLKREEEHLSNSDVVRETSEQGQIIWLKSSPKETTTSAPVPESPEASSRSLIHAPPRKSALI